ncbi:hypothetical protein [Roseateles asaccharophilus]|uniref:hypothetical protein n=1 Tax=Roseateles asaccharophilus TaxID=582607 RepID=UPI00384EEE4A
MKHHPQAVLFDLIAAGRMDSELREALAFGPGRSTALVDRAIAAARPEVLAFQGHPIHDTLGVLNALVTSTFRSDSNQAVVKWNLECIRKLLEAGMIASLPFVYRGGWNSTGHLLALCASTHFEAGGTPSSRKAFLAAEYGALLDLLCEHGLDLNLQVSGCPPFANDVTPMEIAINCGLIVLSNEMALRGATWRTSHVGIKELAGLPDAIKKSMRL